MRSASYKQEIGIKSHTETQLKPFTHAIKEKSCKLSGWKGSPVGGKQEGHTEAQWNNKNLSFTVYTKTKTLNTGTQSNATSLCARPLSFLKKVRLVCVSVCVCE